MSPQQLNAPYWAARTDTICIADDTGTGTCRKPNGTGFTNIDYAFVSINIAQICSRAQPDCEQMVIGPHRPVDYDLDCKEVQITRFRKQQYLDPDPKFKLVPGPTGALTLPPVVINGLFRHHSHDGPPEIKEQEDLEEPNDPPWQHMTVNWQRAQTLAQRAIDCAKTSPKGSRYSTALPRCTERSQT